MKWFEKIICGFVIVLIVGWVVATIVIKLSPDVKYKVIYFDGSSEIIYGEADGILVFRNGCVWDGPNDAGNPLRCGVRNYYLMDK